MTNAYTGESDIKIGDKTCSLIFNWSALAEVKAKGITPEIIQNTFRDTLGSHVDTAVDLILIGLKARHPEVTREQVMEGAPPYRVAIKALDDAFALGCYGPEGVQQIREAVEKMSPKEVLESLATR